MMATAESRRARLRELIRTKYNGVARQFALAAGKPEGQINDMLSTPPRKSFGEKVARAMEEKAGLPDGYFDTHGLAAPAFQVSELAPPDYSAKKTTPPFSEEEQMLVAGYRVANPERQQIIRDLAKQALEFFEQRNEQSN